MNKDTEEIVAENLVLNSIVDRSAIKPEVDSLVEGPVILMVIFQILFLAEGLMTDQLPQKQVEVVS